MTASTTFAPDSNRPNLFPGIVTSRLAPTCEFYRELFGFRAIGGDGDMILLARDDGMQLGLLRAGNLDQPAALQSATRGSGWWLTLESEDVDALFERVSRAGAEVVAPLEFATSAPRRFIVRDPNGVLVLVTEERTAASVSGSSATALQFAHQP